MAIKSFDELYEEAKAGVAASHGRPIRHKLDQVRKRLIVLTANTDEAEIMGTPDLFGGTDAIKEDITLAIKQLMELSLLFGVEILEATTEIKDSSDAIGPTGEGKAGDGSGSVEINEVVAAESQQLEEQQEAGSPSETVEFCEEAGLYVSASGAGNELQSSVEENNKPADAAGKIEDQKDTQAGDSEKGEEKTIDDGSAAVGVKADVAVETKTEVEAQSDTAGKDHVENGKDNTAQQAANKSTVSEGESKALSVDDIIANYKTTFQNARSKPEVDAVWKMAFLDKRIDGKSKSSLQPFKNEAEARLKKGN